MNFALVLFLSTMAQGGTKTKIDFKIFLGNSGSGSSQEASLVLMLCANLIFLLQKMRPSHFDI